MNAFTQDLLKKKEKKNPLTTAEKIYKQHKRVMNNKRLIIKVASTITTVQLIIVETFILTLCLPLASCTHYHLYVHMLIEAPDGDGSSSPVD